MAQAVSPDLFAGLALKWKPGPVEVTDDMNPDPARRLAATLDLDFAAEGRVALPLLWHWMYFPEWPATGQLGEDGHPKDGPFLPPIPNRRRMFAGGRIEVIAPLWLGAPAHRRSCVVNSVAKHGRSGDMLFVTVRHEYSQNHEVVLIEHQDLVYRSDDRPSPAVVRDRRPLTASAQPWQLVPAFDPPLLFRFSALTSNAHRIHYDHAYTTEVEGFPNLVVHGPLLAIYMAELVRSHSGRPVSAFGFRLRQPVFVDDTVRIEGGASGPTANVAIVSGDNVAHASATATFA